MNTIVIKDLFYRSRITAKKILEPAFIGLFLVLPFGTSTRIIMAVICFVLCLLSGRLNVLNEFLKQSWFWPVILLMVLPWFGLLYSPDLGGLGLIYAKKTHYWLYGLALASGIMIFRHSPDVMIRAFIIGLAFNTMVAIIQLVGILPDRSGWYTGLSHSYATLSAYLILGMLLSSFYVSNTDTRREKICWLALLILFFFHLMILQGRTGYLTFLLVSPIIMKNLFSRLNILQLGGIFVLVPCLMMLSPIVRERVDLSIEQVTYHLQADQSLAWGKSYTVHQDRFYMWYGAVELYRDNPFFGVGTGGYQKMMKIRGKEDVPTLAHPHNDFLYMAVHFGFMGIMAYIWLFSGLLRNGWREKHTIRGFFIFAAGLVFIFSGLFNASMLDAGMAMLLSLTVAMQAGLDRFITSPAVQR